MVCKLKVINSLLIIVTNKLGLKINSFNISCKSKNFLILVKKTLVGANLRWCLNFGTPEYLNHYV